MFANYEEEKQFDQVVKEMLEKACEGIVASDEMKRNIIQKLPIKSVAQAKRIRANKPVIAGCLNESFLFAESEEIIVYFLLTFYCKRDLSAARIPLQIFTEADLVREVFHSL